MTPFKRLSAQRTRDAEFKRLVADVQACERCPGMVGRTRVLSAANGDLSSRLLLVAEAPGRFGADRTAVPLAGDRTGRTFEQLLTHAGLARDQVFISNAVLCNPRDALGNNRSPLPAEIRNCASHLERLIEVLDPTVVVTLGAVALRAIELISAHGLALAGAVGRPVSWHGRYLVPLYHPGPRALIHRPLKKQRTDYRRLRRFSQRISAKLVG